MCRPQELDVGFLRLQTYQIGDKAVQHAGCFREPKYCHSTGIRRNEVAPVLGQSVVEPAAWTQHKVGPDGGPPQQPAIHQAVCTRLRQSACRLVKHQHRASRMRSTDTGF